MINQILACFFAIYISHGGKLLHSLVKSSSFLVHRCVPLGAGCRTEIDLCYLSCPPHNQSITNWRLQIARKILWDEMPFFLPVWRLLLHLLLSYNFSIFFVILTFRKLILICVYESWKGPIFPEKRLGRPLPFTPAAAVHTRCKHEMIQGWEKKTLRKIKCKQAKRRHPPCFKCSQAETKGLLASKNTAAPKAPAELNL